MTYLYDYENWIDDLLHATYPSDERFDEWESYYILDVGENTILENIKHSNKIELN